MELFTLKKTNSVSNVTNPFIVFYEIIVVWPGNIKSHMNALFRTIWNFLILKQAVHIINYIL